LVLRQFSQILIGSEQKHPAIPKVSTRCQILLGGRRVGLFDKLCQLKNTVGQCFTAANVAITRLGSTGHNAKGHKLARSGMRLRRGNRIPKSARLGNMMVRRQYQQ